MKSSEQVDKLAVALCKASGNIGAAVKGKENTFFNAKYADLGEVIKTFKGAILEEGLSYVQLPISSEGGVGVVTRLLHVTGQWIEEEYTVPLKKQDPQAAGSAITYCRRYALAAMFGIPTVDDDAQSATYTTEGADSEKAEMAAAVEAIESTATLEELQAEFKRAWGAYPSARKSLTEAKDKRKQELAA